MSEKPSEVIIPQNDEMKIIFPIKVFSGKYDTNSFIPSLVDNKISLIEVNTVIRKIHEETSFMYVIRKSNRRMVYIFLLLLFVLGLFLWQLPPNPRLILFLLEYTLCRYHLLGLCFT